MEHENERVRGLQQLAADIKLIVDRLEAFDEARAAAYVQNGLDILRDAAGLTGDAQNSAEQTRHH